LLVREARAPAERRGEAEAGADGAERAGPRSHGRRGYLLTGPGRPRRNGIANQSRLGKGRTKNSLDQV
jgi:hypothetical protein